jgi:hypothetical protein
MSTLNPLFTYSCRVEHAAPVIYIFSYDVFECLSVKDIRQNQHRSMTMSIRLVCFQLRIENIFYVQLTVFETTFE